MPRKTIPETDRSDSADAFIPDPEEHAGQLDDDLAENLAENFVRAATTGESDAEDERHDQIVPEEFGGPFLETSASDEFANTIDDMNPEDAEAEALPSAVGDLSQEPRQR
jgi:hypothetical protein